MFSFSVHSSGKITMFPTKYQGTWAKHIRSCSPMAMYRASHPYVLYIKPNSLSHSRWYKFKYISVISVSLLEKNRIEASLKFDSEGKSNIESMSFNLLDGGKMLEFSIRDTNWGDPYYKCPELNVPNNAFNPDAN